MGRAGLVWEAPFMIDFVFFWSCLCFYEQYDDDNEPDG